MSGKKRGAERCLCIVTDERRRPAPKLARGVAVAQGKALDGVVCWRVAKLRGCATLLASAFPWAITIPVLSEFGPSM